MVTVVGNSASCTRTLLRVEHEHPRHHTNITWNVIMLPGMRDGHVRYLDLSNHSTTFVKSSHSILSTYTMTFADYSSIKLKKILLVVGEKKGPSALTL